MGRVCGGGMNDNVSSNWKLEWLRLTMTSESIDAQTQWMREKDNDLFIYY